MTPPPELKSYYKLLHCDLVTITERKINGKFFDIVADDEGLFKPDPVISAITEEGKPALVGSILIQRYDPETGGAAELTPEDIETIKSRQAVVQMQSGKKLRVIVLDKGEDF